MGNEKMDFGKSLAQNRHDTFGCIRPSTRTMHQNINAFFTYWNCIYQVCETVHVAQVDEVGNYGGSIEVNKASGVNNEWTFTQFFNVVINRKTKAVYCAGINLGMST